MADDVTNKGASPVVPGNRPFIGVLPVKVFARLLSVSDVPAEIRMKVLDEKFRIRCETNSDSRAHINVVSVPWIGVLPLVERKTTFAVNQSCNVFPA